MSALRRFTAAAVVAAIVIGRVRGRMSIVAILLLANMLPQETIIYPLYHAAKALEPLQHPALRDHHLRRHPERLRNLPAGVGPRQVPQALLEAAALDGPGHWTILWRIVLPVVRPTLSVLLIFFFIWTWNEFFIPLVMLVDNDIQTVPVALASLQGDRITTTNAGALLSLLPAIAFFLILQRTLTRGVAVGAVT